MKLPSGREQEHRWFQLDWNCVGFSSWEESSSDHVYFSALPLSRNCCYWHWKADGAKCYSRHRLTKRSSLYWDSMYRETNPLRSFVGSTRPTTQFFVFSAWRSVQFEAICSLIVGLLTIHKSHMKFRSFSYVSVIMTYPCSGKGHDTGFDLSNSAQKRQKQSGSHSSFTHGSHWTHIKSVVWRDENSCFFSTSHHTHEYWLRSRLVHKLRKFPVWIFLESRNLPAFLQM